MGSLMKLRAGHIYGSNTGRFFFNLDETHESLKGRLLVRDFEYGMAVYDIDGTYTDSIELTGTPAKTDGNARLGAITVHAQFTTDGFLHGQWLSSLGTSGIFIAYPSKHENFSHFLFA